MIVLRNEFTSVEISVDLGANGPRLKVVDLQSNDIKYLDPILVECLTRMPTRLMDPFIVRKASDLPASAI